MKQIEYIFISYSSNDRALAQRLIQDLQEAGFRLWIDMQQVSAGDSYLRATEKGLSNADVLILVASAEALRSKWVTYEWQVFLGDMQYGSDAEKKILIPILIDVSSEKLPLSLQQFVCVDFRKDYEQGLAALLRSLSSRIQQHAPLPPEVPKSKGYVFLSYAAEDSTFVQKLKVFMGERGYAYWDYQESNRNYHIQLVMELEDVIRKAAASLCILSPDWKSSVWALKEYFFALEVKVPVFLLKIREIGPTLAIAGEHYIDFIQDEDRGFQILHSELKRKNL